MTNWQQTFRTGTVNATGRQLQVMSAQIQQITSSSQGSQRQPRYCLRCGAPRKGHPRASCFVAEDEGDAVDAGDGGALVEADGAGDEGRVSTLLPGEGVGDGGDGTVLVEGKGDGGEGGVAVSLEALVDEEPDFGWPDYSWVLDLFEHPFGHYHEGFSGARLMRSSPSNAMIASAS
ncbi:hypothetical protein PsorP6_004514 [Peronosclerospora sorghi]|uniref:Uncharacterized protein n=1 Tax=Peronosclerospora sorghi TaxID=230839 RepID=A0ACC0VKP9_9STRA|nr:hypothetical protein PsorP6_004514 [Peronosclerospora sorghi]